MTKIEAARQEYHDWCEAIGIDTLDKLNQTLAEGKGIELINLCEARQERKYAGMANQIYWRRHVSRIVMISGPSSSGKTSSSLRIAQQCRVLGLTPKVIELDNYFVPRDQTPKDEKGEYDFESLGAMNIEMLDSNLNDLLAGKEVIIPKYDFKEGKTIMDESRRMSLGDKDILFMEGIHALNPALTAAVDQDRIFRIYISSPSAPHRARQPRPRHLAGAHADALARRPPRRDTQHLPLRGERRHGVQFLHPLRHSGAEIFR